MRAEMKMNPDFPFEELGADVVMLVRFPALSFLSLPIQLLICPLC